MTTNIHTYALHIQKANHNFQPTGGPIRLTRTELSNIMADFFDRLLR